METKLTLRLRKNVIDQAKKYASEHETSLSKLIENYLLAVTSESEQDNYISPLVKSLSGVIKLSSDTDLNSEYHKHLFDKYL